MSEPKRRRRAKKVPAQAPMKVHQENRQRPKRPTSMSSNCPACGKGISAFDPEGRPDRYERMFTQGGWKRIGPRWPWEVEIWACSDACEAQSLAVLDARAQSPLCVMCGLGLALALGENEEPPDDTVCKECCRKYAPHLLAEASQQGGAVAMSLEELAAARAARKLRFGPDAPWKDDAS